MFSPLCPPMQGSSALTQPPGPALSTSSSAASSVSGQHPRPRDSSWRRRKREQHKRRRRQLREQEALTGGGGGMGLVEEGEVPVVPRVGRRHRPKKKRQRDRRRDMLRRIGALAASTVEYDDVSSLSEGALSGAEPGTPFPPMLGLIPSLASDRCPSSPGLQQGPFSLLRQAGDGRRKRGGRRQEPGPRRREDVRGGRNDDRRGRLGIGNLLLPEPLLLAPTWRPQEEAKRPAYRPKEAAQHGKQPPKAYRGERAYRAASPGNHRKKSVSPARSPSPGYSGHRAGRRSPNYGDTSPARRRSRSPYSPVSRSGEEWRCQRLILNREVLSVAGMNRFLPLLDVVGKDFVDRVYTQVERSGRGKWTADLNNELFRYALESVSYVLYGQRLGLLKDYVNPESQQFIDSVSLMFHTTSHMLYLPPRLLRLINSSTWKNHVKAWDSIFNHADRCIQGIYSSLRHRSDNTYSGVLSNLLLQDQLPLEDIKASVTELMAGGVDTTSTTLQWAMYELARAPAVQEKLRAEILAARAASGNDLTALLKRIPLVKATLKETLRLHPIAITLQRYTQRDTVIRNYMIPKGTLVQVGLYAMGRNPNIFPSPERFSPERWLGEESTHFRGLGFGFGPRQCIGRRIAEMEMQLFLIHILENFKIDTNRMVEVQTTFQLIIIPSKPIQLTLSPLSPNGSERHS